MIRRAGLDDLDTVVALIDEFYVIDAHDFDRDRVVTALGPLLTDDTYGTVWMVDDDDRSGYAVVTWGYAIESGGRDALLDEIYVRHRGHGLGAELLDTIIDDCRERRLGCLFLETEAPNSSVRRFYARHGFMTDDSVWMSHPLTPRPPTGNPTNAATDFSEPSRRAVP